MPVDLNRLTEGWLELESDPGLFTLLLEDFGVKGVQVEEIYDLQKAIDGPVYGFIFLFKWIEERRSRRKVVITDETSVQDESIVNSIFFAHQVVPDSCATHSLLSVLLNCNKIYLGDTLTRLKQYTSNMSPENKGYAIGNCPELARAHNSHAKPEPRRIHEKSHGISTGRVVDAFHFVSYVPINGHLFELDGLKPFPIDHGPWSENEDWCEKFRRVITERLGIATGGEPYHDIRFNLMAVVPERRIAYEQKLKTLKTNRRIVMEALQQLVKLKNSTLKKDDGNSKASDRPMSPSNRCVTPDDCCRTALEGHNYAKSPLLEGKCGDGAKRPKYEDCSGSEYSSDEDDPTRPRSVHSSSRSQAPRVRGAMDVGPCNDATDYSRPLSIQTKFETNLAPSCSSTDTASEVGSAFNSPVRTIGLNSSQSSPNLLKDIKKLVVIRVTGGGSHSKDTEEISTTTTSQSSRNSDVQEAHSSTTKRIYNALTAKESLTNGIEDSNNSNNKREVRKESSKYGQFIEPHTFAPKDLVALIRNIDNEITICENNLRDEIEQRKRYKIDDIRRTHNYDEFIHGFLSKLESEGCLTDLVQQHTITKKRQGVAAGRSRKARKGEQKRRKARPRKKK